MCDWIGKEIASPRYPIYKDFLTSFVTPNLSWFAYVVFLTGSLYLLFAYVWFLTRLGEFVGFAMGINLFIGLTLVSGEWDWTYLMLPLLNGIFIVVGGRFYRRGRCAVPVLAPTGRER